LAKFKREMETCARKSQLFAQAFALAQQILPRTTCQSVRRFLLIHAFGSYIAQKQQRPHARQGPYRSAFLGSAGS